MEPELDFGVNSLPFTVIESFNNFVEDFEFGAEKPDLKHLRRTGGLLVEEALETELAIGDFLPDKDNLEHIDKMIDGFADTAFVAFNGIYKTYRYLGANPEKATLLTILSLAKLALANESKRGPNGEVVKDVTGKVMKPEGFEPPSYIELIKIAMEK